MIKTFTKKEIKKIVTTAIDQEKKDENIDVNFFTLDFVELYHHFKSDKKYSLFKIEITKGKKEILSITAPPIIIYNSLWYDD